jgi:hypothetical protein
MTAWTSMPPWKFMPPSAIGGVRVDMCTAPSLDFGECLHSWCCMNPAFGCFKRLDRVSAAHFVSGQRLPARMISNLSSVVYLPSCLYTIPLIPRCYPHRVMLSAGPWPGTRKPESASTETAGFVPKVGCTSSHWWCLHHHPSGHA